MGLDNFIRFDYSITRPFSERWRHTDIALLVFAIVSLASFVAVNVVLVGYDIISYSSSNFNASQQLSWIPSWKEQAPSCQEHTFQLGDSFRTNTSAFSYTIFNVISSRPDATVQGSFAYANNTLEKCDPSQFELTVSPGDRLVSINAIIDCPPPLGFKASTSWSYTNHPVIDLVPPSVFPENSLARAILDAMREFGGEAYYQIYQTQYILKSDGTQLYKVRVEAQPLQACGRPSSPPCPLNGSNVAYTMYNGISLTNLRIAADSPTGVQADFGSLMNLVEIFYAGIRLDFGHWTPNNLFTNVTSFKTAVLPFVADASYTGSKIRDPASSKGLAYVNATSPPAQDVATPPAVVQILYTCNKRRRKSPGSFVVSVLSATLSMFLSAWGLVIAVLGGLARRGQGANSCGEIHKENLSGRSLKQDSYYRDHGENQHALRDWPSYHQLSN